MTRTRNDYEVRTAKGAVIRKFDDLESARAWTKANRATFPGCTVDHVKVTVIEERKTVYRPRPVTA